MVLVCIRHPAVIGILSLTVCRLFVLEAELFLARFLSSCLLPLTAFIVTVTVKWPKDRTTKDSVDKTMYCIVHAYAISTVPA